MENPVLSGVEADSSSAESQPNSNVFTSVAAFQAATVEELQRLVPEGASTVLFRPASSPAEMRKLIQFLWEADGAY